jgi:hypothetical protein
VKNVEPQEAMDLLRYSLVRQGGQVSKTIYHGGKGPFVLGLMYRKDELLFCVYEFIPIDDLIEKPFAPPAFLHQKQFIFKMLDTMGLNRDLYRAYRDNREYPLYFQLTPEDSKNMRRVKSFFAEQKGFIDCSLLIDSSGAIRRAERQKIDVDFQ